MSYSLKRASRSPTCNISSLKLAYNSISNLDAFFLLKVPSLLNPLLFFFFFCQDMSVLFDFQHIWIFLKIILTALKFIVHSDFSLTIAVNKLLRQMADNCEVYSYASFTSCLPSKAVVTTFSLMKG